MPETAPPRRAALYVDFDNVFMALLRWDERAAYAFGERPDAWLAWLERGPEGDAPRRRTLVRRCYLNPGRWLDFPPGGPVARYRETHEKRNRIYFADFRNAFVRAGFDVVDCPPVASLKNAADMKMALDIREALDHPTRFDEFVLLSGDSDFLPALMRLRAHDRRITILAQDTAKEAYLAAADEALGLVEFANEGMGALPIAGFGLAVPPRERAVPPPRLPEPPRRAAEPSELRAAVLDWLREGLARNPAGAVRMTAVGHEALRAFPTLRETRYAGAGTLARLVEEAGDPRLAIGGPSQARWLFDPGRGGPPGATPGSEEAPENGIPAPETPAEPERAPEPEPDQTTPEAEEPAEAPYAQEPEESWPEAEAARPEAEEPSAAQDEAEAPAPPTAPQPPEDPAARKAAMAAAAAKVRDILWGKRDLKGFPLDLPAFCSEEIGFVLQGIAACAPFGPGRLESVAREIASEGAARAILVSPREVVAIIRWLLRGRVSFRDRMPPGAALRLAEALCDQLSRAVERAAAQRSTAPWPEERMTEADWVALAAWASAGLEAPPQ